MITKGDNSHTILHYTMYSHRWWWQWNFYLRFDV